MLISNRKEQKRFIKFGLVGALGAVIDFGVFNLFIHLLRFKPIHASIISFVCAVLSNFLLNRYWTYPDSRSKRFRRQFIQFFLVSSIGLGIRTLFFTPLENVFLTFADQIIPETFMLSPAFFGYNFTLAVLILIVMFWNFFANRFWTYNDVSS
ncbi:MAG TPA: GtrA family protein [Anaerolineaceae bacterium]|nr:GtrA family protein [Anaerolineaceae bacterium]